jgi:hypothetical protein
MKQIHGPYIFDRNVRTDVAYSRPIHAVAKFHFVSRCRLNPFETVCFELEENRPWIARKNRASGQFRGKALSQKMVY